MPPYEYGGALLQIRLPRTDVVSSVGILAGSPLSRLTDKGSTMAAIVVGDTVVERPDVLYATMLERPTEVAKADTGVEPARFVRLNTTGSAKAPLLILPVQLAVVVSDTLSLVGAIV